MAVIHLLQPPRQASLRSTAWHGTATQCPLGHLAAASRWQPPRWGQHQQWDPEEGSGTCPSRQGQGVDGTVFHPPWCQHHWQGQNVTKAIPDSPHPSPKGRGVAGATCSHGTPILLVSSPSPSSADGCPFNPCQHQAAALPISNPSHPGPTASTAAPMGVSRTGPAIPACCGGKNPPVPTRAASLGISIPGTLSSAFCSPAGEQPPGKGWHSSQALAAPAGLPRLPQPRREQAPAWHAAGANFGPKGFPSADSAASVVLKTILAGVFLPRLPVTRSRAGVFVLCVHVCVYLQTATNISCSFSFFPPFFFFFPPPSPWLWYLNSRCGPGTPCQNQHQLRSR